LANTLSATYSNRLQPDLQNLQLQHVVRLFHPRSSCTTHISANIRTSADICPMRRAWRSRVEQPNN